MRLTASVRGIWLSPSTLARAGETRKTALDSPDISCLDLRVFLWGMTMEKGECQFWGNDTQSRMQNKGGGRMHHECVTTKRRETWDKESPSNSSSLVLLASLGMFDIQEARPR